MEPYPLLFAPILKERVWGGRHLEALGKKLPAGARIGESWELADLPPSVPEGRSVIANGPLAGRTLHEAIQADRRSVAGAAALTAEGGFPLLVKFLDACENLSVQVHPGEDYAEDHPGTRSKSEAWVVLRAEPGALIYKGLKPHVTREAFAQHVERGTVVEDLCAVAARAGDCHDLPAGTCHALGAGIVVAEIQTPSDTTFRVYDWGRTGRALHVEQALRCIHFGGPPSAPRPGVPVEAGGVRSTPLLRCRHFGIERIEAVRAARLPIATSGMPLVWMVLAGGATIGSRAAGGEVRLMAGTTVLLPAGLTGAAAELERGTELLHVTVRSPLQGLIA